MKFTEAGLGRVFVLRLEDGETLPEAVEAFCRQQGLRRGLCLMLGGVGGGNIVSGPKDGDARPVEALLHAIKGVHEAAGVGTIFPDGDGAPVLHMHAALGRAGKTAAGCIRPGIEVWQLCEFVILELTGLEASRVLDGSTGFEVLEP